MLKSIKQRSVALFSAVAMSLSPVSGSMLSVPVSAEEDADWGFNYVASDYITDESEGDTANENGNADYSDTAISIVNDYTDYTDTDSYSTDYAYDSYNVDNGYESENYEVYDNYTEEDALEAEIGEEVYESEYEEENIFYAASPKLAGPSTHTDNKTYYISGFNATIFYRSDGSVPEYQFNTYYDSSYTHDIQTPPDVIVEPIGYCIQRNGNHTVPTQGLTRHTVSEIVAGNVAGVYMTQQQADALIRVLLHKSECYSYGASIIGRYYPGRTISDIRPGMDSSVCKDYITQQYCWGACQTDFSNAWNSDVANWAYTNFSETCTGGQGYDINYYVSNNASQQNVIGSVFRGTQNNPADPYVDSASITVVKTDENNRALGGARFTVYDDVSGTHMGDSIVGTPWTTSATQPSHTVEGLNYGLNFILRENTAPQGYTKASDTYFKVDLNGNIIVTQLGSNTTYNNGVFTVKNNVNKNRILVMKVDEEGSSVSGAEFTVTDENGTVYAQEATGNGFFADLIAGHTYTIKEVVTPDGYIPLENDITLTLTGGAFSIRGEGATATLDNGIIDIEITNKKAGHPVSVVKVSEEGKSIAGATFTLTDGDNKSVDFTETASGFDAVLNENVTYTLTETSAPEGYVKRTEPVTFTVSANGIECTDSGVVTNGFTLSVVNEPIDYKATIDKVDSDTNALISGARIQLIDNGSVIDEWTTDTHTTDTLEYNKEYTIHEVSAPEGYILSTNDITFSFNKDGSVNTNATVRNGHIIVGNRQTSISVTKMDVTNNTELAGATLQVLDNNGNIVKEWQSTTEPYTIKGLKTNTEYILREKTAPLGYSVATDTSFVINEDGSVTTTANQTSDGTILVEDSMLTVYVSKQDIANEKELSGAQLQVLDNGTVVDEWTSNGTKHLIRGIQPDKAYILREKVAPAGYVITTDISFKAAIKDEKTIITTTAKVVDGDTIVVDNKPTEVNISKRAVTGEDELSGAKLQILNGETVVESWTSSDTVHTIKGLETGVTYTLRETSAPKGYVCVADTTFVIDTNGRVTASATQSADDTIIIRDEVTKVSIAKTDITSGDEIEGAKLQVIKDGSVVEEWTSEKKAHVIEGLETEVDYTLHEETAPFGYVLAEDTTFHIEKDGTVVTTGSMNSEGTIILNNTKTKIAISKVDIANNEELAGATLQILDNNGSVVAEWVSTTTPREIIGLGTNVQYTLRETIAPKGYTCATDITFTIDEHGEVSTTGRRNADSAIVIDNRLTEILISKVDITSQYELEGATLQVIDKEGNVTEEWVSTTEAHKIIGLSTGEEYTLRETVAPDGYAIATDTKFTIKTNGDVESSASVTDGNHILFENSKTKVNITKFDIATEKELAGAHIQLLDKDGKIVEEWNSTTETHTIEGLKTDVLYTLHETVAPKGYVIASSDTEFRLDEKGNVSSSGTVVADNTVLVDNRPTEISISKVDITTEEEVAGAKLQILDGETVVEEWISTADSEHIIYRLETEKEYILREIIAPDGYTLATDTTFTIHEDNSVTTNAPVTTDGILLVKDAKTKVNISKVNITDKKELAGAKLEILENGTVVESWTSDNTVHTIEGLKTGVDYTLRETVAPVGFRRLTTDVTFSIGTDGTITSSAPITEDGVILIENTRQTAPEQPVRPVQPTSSTPSPSYSYTPPSTPPSTPVTTTTPVTVTPKPVEDVSSGAGLYEDGEILL